MARLEGKVALVTGGSRGIGAAIARRLAADGAHVALTYVGREADANAVVAAIVAHGGRASAHRADNRDAAALESMVSTVVDTHGRIDILVNNAGVFDAAPIEALDVDAFDRAVDINVRAVFVASRAVAAHMPEGGRIISIGSNLAQRVPWPGYSLYALTKSALVGFTKGLARDLGPRRINVNLVHPGSTDTEMNPAAGDGAHAQMGAMAIPRFADADDVAGLVTWLAGPEARSVTGAEFTIDGGTNA
jgi:NAD(P)-dependent dehydrogenase (short-subunit alcohol dehydrogenase family)